MTYKCNTKITKNMNSKKVDLATTLQNWFIKMSFNLKEEADWITP